MRNIIATSVLVAALGLAGGAGAATATPEKNVPAQQTQTPDYAKPVIADANAMKAADQIQPTNLRKQIEDQLSKQGFTGIKIMPSSFYVQAKDKNGDPVSMVIGPDSFTEVTEVPAKAAAAQQMPDNSKTPQTSAQQK